MDAGASLYDRDSNAPSAAELSAARSDGFDLLKPFIKHVDRLRLANCLTCKVSDDIMQHLLDGGADVASLDAFGQSVLFNAIKHQLPTKWLKVLINKGASIHGGRNPALAATVLRTEHRETEYFCDAAVLLLQNGADALAEMDRQDPIRGPMLQLMQKLPPRISIIASAVVHERHQMFRAMLDTLREQYPEPTEDHKGATQKNAGAQDGKKAANDDGDAMDVDDEQTADDEPADEKTKAARLWTRIKQQVCFMLPIANDPKQLVSMLNLDLVAHDPVGNLFAEVPFTFIKKALSSFNVKEKSPLITVYGSE
jgi:hypothetical protein